MKGKLLPIGLMILLAAAINLRPAHAFDWVAINPALEGATSVKDRARCIECHPDYAKSFENTIHSKVFKDKEAEEGIACERCHGPMSKHAVEGNPEFVISLKKIAPKQKSKICLQCHEGGKRALWSGSIHEGRGLSCDKCHYVMEKRSDRSLFIAEDVQAACFKCHKQVRAQMNKQSHHPIREGKLKCYDCHNPHGTVSDKLISANSINEKCFECHAEKRGPFLWEHPPATESCLTCHTPHGSSHDKLLVAKRPYLCQRCHSVSRHPGTLYALSDTQAAAGNTVYQAVNSRLFYRSCQNCHSQIHGSNHPSGKFYQR